MLGQIGQYQLLNELGSGGMGVVYRALDLQLQREVALKRLRSEFAASPAVLERFRNEAKLQGRLNHPNIAQLYNLVQTPDAFCIVMEFIRGVVVQELLPLSCEQAVAVMVQVLAGLECAHDLGVLHRDMKPENILIDSTGTVKVMDFGIAYAVGSERMTREKSLIGTMEYMPPERILGREVTARSDIYSLGIMLFEMISGRLPFGSMSEYDLLRWHVEQDAPPLTTLVDAPPIIDHVISRAMKKDPDQRYPSCSSMAEDLKALLRGQNPQAVLAPLVLRKVETARVFDRKSCFADVRSELARGNTARAEKILSTAANRHPGEPGLRQYQALLSRSIFEMDIRSTEPRSQTIKLLVEALAAERCGDMDAVDGTCAALREQIRGTPLAMVI
jgi:serine/threonine protein kinase